MEPVRILFMDDEPGILITMPEALRQRGFSVTAVGTVNEALSEITYARRSKCMVRRFVASEK